MALILIGQDINPLLCFVLMIVSKLD